jgi:hypothetical protein
MDLGGIHLRICWVFNHSINAYSFSKSIERDRVGGAFSMISNKIILCEHHISVGPLISYQL